MGQMPPVCGQIASKSISYCKTMVESSLVVPAENFVQLENNEVLTAAPSPWQLPYVERLIGSIRCECLDHVVIMNESSLRRHVSSYLDYYHGSRSHLSLGKDSPAGRAVEAPERGAITAVPKVGGLHHRYQRRAA
jgi:putative transposase